MKIFWAFCLAIINIVCGYSQQIKISCRLLNSKNIPIEYANVQLLDKDSVFITGTVSSPDGKVELRATANRDYRLSFSAIGYEPKTMYLLGINVHTDLGNIILEESTVALEEVTVTGSQMVRQIDRQIAFPNSLQLNSATGVLEMLRNMSFPQLNVDVQQKTVKMSDNGSVQLRINGVPVKIQEVEALLPKDIIRIEFHDNPGVRITDKGLVDFIVKRRDTGGYVSVSLTNSPHVAFGDDSFFAKFNHRNSEWTASYSLSYREYQKRWADEEIFYNYPDQTFLKKEEKGVPSPFDYQTHNVGLNYNYTLVDRRVLNVSATTELSNQNQYYESMNYYSNNFLAKKYAKRYNDSKASNPTVDIYYKENLSSTQNMMFNLVGGYANSDYNNNYTEEDELEGLYSESISIVNGDSYFLAGQADHQKSWKNMMLYSGAKYTYNYANNDYRGSYTKLNILKSQNLYMYTQLYGQWKNIRYTVGVGASYYSFKDQNDKLNHWNFIPYASLFYSPVEGLSLNYMFNSSLSNPSLNQLSEITQDINALEVIRGNPFLKPYYSFFNRFNINYYKKNFQFFLGVSHMYYKNVIGSYMYYDSDINRFVSTNINHNFFQKVQVYGQINWQVVPNMLSIGLNGLYDYNESDGIDYYHKYNSFYGGGNINFYYKNWRAFAQAGSRRKYLWGEVLSYAPIETLLELGYNYKKLYVGARVYRPFLFDYEGKRENFSKVRPSVSCTYIDDAAPIVTLRLSWNFAWGRKSKAEKQNVNNKKIDTGILKVD